MIYFDIEKKAICKLERKKHTQFINHKINVRLQSNSMSLSSLMFFFIISENSPWVVSRFYQWLAVFVCRRCNLKEPRKKTMYPNGKDGKKRTHTYYIAEPFDRNMMVVCLWYIYCALVFQSACRLDGACIQLMLTALQMSQHFNIISHTNDEMMNYTLTGMPTHNT